MEQTQEVGNMKHASKSDAPKSLTSSSQDGFANSLFEQKSTCVLSDAATPPTNDEICTIVPFWQP
jgi:hypothetical protein